MKKRTLSRRYLKDGYVNAAVVLFIVNVSFPIGRLLDGEPFLMGRFAATYYAAVLMACLVLLFIGVRRVKQNSEG